MPPSPINQLSMKSLLEPWQAAPAQGKVPLWSWISILFIVAGPVGSGFRAERAPQDPASPIGEDRKDNPPQKMRYVGLDYSITAARSRSRQASECCAVQCSAAQPVRGVPSEKLVRYSTEVGR